MVCMKENKPVIIYVILAVSTFPPIVAVHKQVGIKQQGIEGTVKERVGQRVHANRRVCSNYRGIKQLH